MCGYSFGNDETKTGDAPFSVQGLLQMPGEADVCDGNGFWQTCCICRQVAMFILKSFQQMINQKCVSCLTGFHNCHMRFRANCVMRSTTMKVFFWVTMTQNHPTMKTKSEYESHYACVAKLDYIILYVLIVRIYSVLRRLTANITTLFDLVGTLRIRKENCWAIS